MILLVANSIKLQSNTLKRHLELKSTIWGRGSTLENPKRMNSSVLS
jgi:hypothetical protein